MNVSAILSLKGRDIISVTPSASISDVTKVFAKHSIGSILVLENDQLKGIVSERDVVRSVGREGAEVLSRPVSTIMTKEVQTCVLKDTTNHIMTVMTAGRFRHVPVVEEGKLIGIISIGDVVQQRISEAELEASSMRSYIATG